MSGPWAGKRIAYAPYSPTLDQPGDRRRFVHWATARDVPFELARPDEHYDLVVLSARADLAHWSTAADDGSRVIFDLIDSYLDERPTSWRRAVRGTGKYLTGELSRWVPDYGAALERMCRRADVVVCSTPEQQRRLEALNPLAFPILDVQDGDVRAVKSSYEIDGTVHLAWEGLPYTLGGFDVVRDVLRDLATDVPLTLHVVSALRFGQFGGRFHQRDTVDVVRDILPGRTHLYEWDSHLVSRILTGCDIAVIPLDLRDPFTAGKPENKLLYFWRLAMPTITSATPAYVREMQAAGLDLTCETTEDWARHLRHLATDDAARAEAGRAGNAYVTAHRSTAATLARWDEAITTALG